MRTTEIKKLIDLSNGPSEVMAIAIRKIKTDILSMEAGGLSSRSTLHDAANMVMAEQVMIMTAELKDYLYTLPESIAISVPESVVRDRIDVIFDKTSSIRKECNQLMDRANHEDMSSMDRVCEELGSTAARSTIMLINNIDSVAMKIRSGINSKPVTV